MDNRSVLEIAAGVDKNKDGELLKKAERQLKAEGVYDYKEDYSEAAFHKNQQAIFKRAGELKPGHK